MRVNEHKPFGEEKLTENNRDRGIEAFRRVPTTSVDMARAVDEQPCEETQRNSVQKNGEAVVETNRELQQCHHEDSQTALLNEVNTNASSECNSVNSIPKVSIKAGYIIEDDQEPYEMAPCSKDKMFELSMEDKVDLSAKENDADNVAPQPTWRLCMTISVLLLANVLNYMDRYTIAGM